MLKNDKRIENFDFGTGACGCHRRDGGKAGDAASRVATFGLRPKAPGQAHAFLKLRQNKSTKGEDLR